jgi:tetratricopeptide (TPR) repeat protein
LDPNLQVVLAAIVQGCVRAAASAFEAMADGGAEILCSVARMLMEVGDYTGALVPLEQALEKLVVRHGEGAHETAETVYLCGQCHRRTDGESMTWYERSLRLEAREFGEEDAATARSLVGIGSSHGLGGDQAKRIECCTTAIARIKGAERPMDHADAHTDALCEIGQAHFRREEWKECLARSEESVAVRESAYGPDHVLAARALANMATAYGKLGDRATGRAIEERVLEIQRGARAAEQVGQPHVR